MNYLLPVAFAIVLWWLTTIVLLWRLRLAPRTYPLTMALVTMLLVFGCYGVYLSLTSDSVWSAYLAFSGALAIWCWHEASYFLGYLTGPRPEACPPHCTGWSRFTYGVKASLYHELAVIATAVLLIWLSQGAANTIAMQAFVVLWLMRWSTKMNIFFGVSNLHEEFWPERLRYLGSYVTSARGNLFFPVSVALAVVFATWVGAPLWSASGNAGDVAGAVLVLTLLGLACLEHVFLLIPVPDAWLWKWGLATPDPAERVSARAMLVGEDRLASLSTRPKSAG